MRRALDGCARCSGAHPVVRVHENPREVLHVHVLLLHKDVDHLVEHLFFDPHENEAHGAQLRQRQPLNLLRCDGGPRRVEQDAQELGAELRGAPCQPYALHHARLRRTFCRSSANTSGVRMHFTSATFAAACARAATVQLSLCRQQLARRMRLPRTSGRAIRLYHAPPGGLQRGSRQLEEHQLIWVHHLGGQPAALRPAPPQTRRGARTFLRRRSIWLSRLYAVMMCFCGFGSRDAAGAPRCGGTCCEWRAARQRARRVFAPARGVCATPAPPRRPPGRRTR